MTNAHEFSDGFLGEEVAAVREMILNQYADWRALLRETNRNAVSQQYLVDCRSGCPRELIGATSYARILATVQASILLLERGLPSQARALLRTALESLFMLAAVERDPGFADLLAESEGAERRSLAEKMLRWSAPELREAVTNQITDEKLSVLASSPEREVKMYRVAEVAEMTDWYLSIYALLSQNAHATLTDLRHHIGFDQAGDVQFILNEPTVDGLHETWSYAVEILLRAQEGFASIFGHQAVGSKDGRERLSNLAAQMVVSLKKHT